MYNLPSTNALTQKHIKQMGVYAFTRWCYNLGLTFDETYVLIFDRLPK